MKNVTKKTTAAKAAKTPMKVLDTIHAGGGIFVDIEDTAKKTSAPVAQKKSVSAAKAKKAVHALVDSIVKQAAASAPAAQTKTKTKATKKTAEKTAAAPTLAIHVNSTGRVVFNRVAAERLGKSKYVEITPKGKSLLFVPCNRTSDSALPVRFSHGRPYISATKQLTESGLFSGKPLDLRVAEHAANGFAVSI